MLRIKLFGTLEVACDGHRMPPFSTRTASSVFSYLLLNRNRFHARERLAGTFWPGCPEGTALKRLRTALWRVRTVLQPEEDPCGESYLRTGSRGVAFDGEADVWVDVDAFEDRIRRADDARDRADVEQRAKWLRSSVMLYRGDLLEDIYDEWCLVERERLRRLLVGAYERLMRISAMREEWGRAVDYAQRLLGHDPLREHIHRRLMRLYYHMGDRPAALQQYRRCEELLADALDVEPMEQTRALVRAIREESGRLRGPASRRLRPRRRAEAQRGSRPGTPRRLFTEATQDVEEALDKLRRGLDGIPGDVEDEAVPGSSERRGPDDSPATDVS